MPTAARTLCPVRRTPDRDGEQVTQLLPDEPVEPLEVVGDWTRVVAPWQPSSLDPAGYPGWVLSAHLGEVEAPAPYPAATGSDGPALLTAAAAYLDTPYLWGGMTTDGIDCSGLVHGVARGAGLRVPRDASDQSEQLEPVALDAVRAGDLYLFARPGRRVHHVGFVAGPAASRRILHAPDGGTVRRVVEEDLSPERLDTLVGAARLVTD